MGTSEASLACLEAAADPSLQVHLHLLDCSAEGRYQASRSRRRVWTTPLASISSPMTFHLLQNLFQDLNLCQIGTDVQVKLLVMISKMSSFKSVSLYSEPNSNFNHSNTTEKKKIKFKKSSTLLNGPMPIWLDNGDPTRGC